MITKVAKSELSGPVLKSTYCQDEEKACWKVRAVEKYFYDILPRWRKSMFKVRTAQTLNEQYCTSVLGQKHFHFSFPNHDYWLRMIMLTIMIYIFVETIAPNTTFFIIWTFSGGQQPTHNVQKAVVVKHWQKAKHQLKRNMKLKRTHWIWPSSRLNFPALFWIWSLFTGCPHFRATKSKSTAQILGSGVFTEISRDA